MNETDNY